MILVDTPGRYDRLPFGQRYWCHMTSDTSLDELHVFARGIGVTPGWFEDKSTPHYDLTEEQRRRAVQRGAVEVSRLELVRRGIRGPSRASARPS
jgi:hypothetical protein